MLAEVRMKEVLYISYDGALEPIPQAQVIPYLIGLSSKGYRFHWLSFEKINTPNFRVKKEELRQALFKHNIIWHSLVYRRRPYLLAKAFNISCGIIFCILYVLKKDIAVIHCRGEVASVIGMAVKVFLKKRLIYDRRAFMAEDYVEGGMWKSRESFLYKLLIFIDKELLSYSNRVVILTNVMKNWLLDYNPDIKNKLTVIPCCVDINRFALQHDYKIRDELGFNGKFVFVYSGSLGTWYLLNEMVDFFMVAQRFFLNPHFLILTMSDKRIIVDAIRSKQISQKANFTIRNLGFNEVPKFLTCADAAICFIKPIVSKLASSPTKFAEFLASGLPVVMNSGIGDCDEIVERERIGVINKGFSLQEYERTTVALMNLLKDGQKLKNRCIESAKKYFSLDDGVSKYSEVYESIF